MRWSRVKEDSAIGIILSVFFGAGIVLLTWIQKRPEGNQSGLDKYLFGQAATLVEEDLKVMAILGAVVLVAVLLFYKELKLLSFDRAFGASLGYPMKSLEVLLTLLLVVVVVVGLQTVGVVLIVAALITPAAAARQWTDRLGVMVLLASCIGAISGVAGSLASAYVPRLPTGPVIVVVSSGILIVSLLFAPQRGLVWALLRERAVAARIRRENLLKDLWLQGERQEDWAGFLSWPLLMGVRGQTAGDLTRSARPLARAGLVERLGGRPAPHLRKAAPRPRRWCASTASGSSTSPGGWSCPAITSTATPRPWSTLSPTTPSSAWKSCWASPRPIPTAGRSRRGGPHEPGADHHPRGRLRGRQLRPGRIVPGAAQAGSPGRRHQPRRPARHRPGLPAHRQPRRPSRW